MFLGLAWLGQDRTFVPVFAVRCDDHNAYVTGALDPLCHPPK